jgi:hypothetical protein
VRAEPVCVSPIDVARISDLYTERYFKKLIGRKDVEDALQRLDKLTQEEARMAATESLTITRGIDDRVRAVDHNVIEGELYRVSLSPNLSSVFSESG